MNKIFDGNYLLTPEQKEYIEKQEQQIKELKEDLKCDVCGFHPNVIITTSKGRFCQEHAQY